jgi:cell division protein FtsA
MMFWKKEPDIIAALEIGTRKIAAAVGELREDGSLAILGVGESASAGIRKGEVVDYPQAQQAVRDAILDAEQKTGIEIKEVYLALTGSHLASRNVLVKTATEEDNSLVTLDHVRELDEQAAQTGIPADHEVIHELIQFYYLDNRVKTTEPVGLSSREMEASYHLVSGLRTRLETQVRCVVELDIEVVAVAMASYASAQALLTPEDKKLGSVLIDMGAGVTDYIVYVGGAVIHSGVIGVGGDHLTQDLALGLKLPYLRAEELKVRHGSLRWDLRHQPETLTLPRDATTEERTVWMESVATVMQARQRETLELIRADLEAQSLWPQLTGRVFLTGGASRVDGLSGLAARLFPIPCVVMNESRFEGDMSHNRRPELSTVLGLLRYAQNVEQASARPRGLARLGSRFRELLSSMNLF